MVDTSSTSASTWTAARASKSISIAGWRAPYIGYSDARDEGPRKKFAASTLLRSMARWSTDMGPMPIGLSDCRAGSGNSDRKWKPNHLVGGSDSPGSFPARIWTRRPITSLVPSAGVRATHRQASAQKRTRLEQPRNALQRTVGAVQNDNTIQNIKQINLCDVSINKKRKYLYNKDFRCSIFLRNLQLKL